MKFHSLIAAALLLACAAGAAFIATAEAAADAPSLHLPPARDAGHVTLYRNGELALNLHGSAGLDILRSSLANFFEDEHPAAPPAWPREETGRRICAQQTKEAILDAVPASEPLSLGMLGAGFALMGWTRRRENRLDKRKGRQGWRFDLFPWPALCWLD